MSGIGQKNTNPRSWIIIADVSDGTTLDTYPADEVVVLREPASPDAAEVARAYSRLAAEIARDEVEGAAPDAAAHRDVEGDVRVKTVLMASLVAVAVGLIMTAVESGDGLMAAAGVTAFWLSIVVLVFLAREWE